MNSSELQSLKNELHRFERKPCRSCQIIFGFGVLVFLLSLTLFLFAQQGVPPSSVISVEALPREKPLTFKEEANIMGELRELSREKVKSVPEPSQEDAEAHAVKYAKPIQNQILK
jgi:hypothetical protein